MFEDTGSLTLKLPDRTCDRGAFLYEFLYACDLKQRSDGML
ncbi:MAG: hypothetical protein ACO331_16035 [Prochlorothrix sp.]